MTCHPTAWHGINSWLQQNICREDTSVFSLPISKSVLLVVPTTCTWNLVLTLNAWFRFGRLFCNPRAIKLYYFLLEIVMSVIYLLKEIIFFIFQSFHMAGKKSMIPYMALIMLSKSLSVILTFINTLWNCVSISFIEHVWLTLPLFPFHLTLKCLQRFWQH